MPHCWKTHAKAQMYIMLETSFFRSLPTIYEKIQTLCCFKRYEKMGLSYLPSIDEKIQPLGCFVLSQSPLPAEIFPMPFNVMLHHTSKPASPDHKEHKYKKEHP